MTITGDTDPNNPVNTYPQNMFPIGAALTVAYGSTERPLCTLGNLYRILGYLTGDVPPADGQAARAADPLTTPPITEQPYIAGINDEIVRCRDWVRNQLPDNIIGTQPANADGFNSTLEADVAWLSTVTTAHGPTITLTALPGTINNPAPEGTPNA